MTRRNHGATRRVPEPGRSTPASILSMSAATLLPVNARSPYSSSYAVAQNAN